MADTLTCPECGAEIDSADQLEHEHEVAEVELEDSGSISLYGNRDLYMCKNCKRTLGVSRGE